VTEQWQRWKGIQKCYPFEEKRLAKWEPPYLIQPKYDGVRCRAIHTDTGYILLSSEENVIFSVPHINEVLNKTGLDCELDGELYSHGMSFESIVSITSRSVNLHHNSEVISYHIFDVVNELPQIKRLSFIKTLSTLSPHLIIAPVHICYNLEDVLRAYDSIVNAGYEGIIVRHWMSPYERKRSTLVMKFKPKQQDDYEITGFVEEVSKDGECKDTLGALVCKSGDGNIFNVGTGFTDERRKELWEGRDLLIGQMAQLKYQHITSGNKVPRFPVFVEVKVRT
jgi:ATP-dependent DNA ligase